MPDKDVTDLVDFGNSDDECLPLTKCVCGQEFSYWNFTLSIYRDMVIKPCPNCGRKLYWRSMGIRVFEVVEEGEIRNRDE